MGGYAGEVVKTFGEFVIQGDVVVGLVIFLIIVLVQFIVITKGSERVAEVSARFTLDAMPGKQMAIDADLSSGLIDEAQARIRRSKIQREADFFGAIGRCYKVCQGRRNHVAHYDPDQLSWRRHRRFCHRSRRFCTDYGHLFDRYGGRWIDVADSCAADFRGDRHDRYPFRIRIEP